MRPPHYHSMQYLVTKVQAAVATVLDSLASSANRSIPSLLERGLEVYNRPLTGLMLLAGDAMAPTLNPAVVESDAAKNAPTAPPSTEKLLVRWLQRPSSRNVFPDDVIAFQSPLGDQAHVLVRRVAAGEGHEMISDDPDETSFRLPPGTCWVLADNDTLEPQQVIDSRSFGPLPYEHIVGRVLYHARSTHDHGVVENSEEAMAADAPVLAAELDVDGLLSGEMEELEKQ